MKTSTAVSVGVLLLLLSTFQLAAFTIEDRVQCTDNLNVRATPSTTGTIVTTEASGSRGIIIDGPQSANGYTWWRISWDNGHAGWSVQPYLTLVTWYSLNIASSNPNNGVYIYVGPDDFLGQADDTTAFLRFFDAGTLVTLIAPITAGGNNFVKWTRNGSDFSFSTTVDFAMSADYTVTAVYSAAPPVTHTLTVSSANPDSGISITANQTDNYGNLGGVTSFTRTFNHNAAVSFNASATAGGNTFQKWRKDGVDLTTSSTAFVTMDANHTITAVYTTPSFTITTGVSPSGAGTASGGGPFTSGQTVTVVATPNPGYPFVNWTDGGNQVSASANYSFTANGNRNLIANFCGGATDLMVDNASFTPVSRSPGQSFTLNFRIRNLGNVWSCPSRARMRLTADAVLTESDAGLLPLDFLFSTLAPGGATNVSIQVVVPASASPGSYFVGVWVDPDRLLNQINRANDVVLSLAKLTLAGTGGPSLQVTPVAQQVGAYDTTASFLVQNAGGGTMSWNASIIGAPWLHFIGGSGGTVPLGGVQLIVLCDANATSTPRTGSITISAPGAIPASQTVSVTQAANFPTMPRVNWFEFSAIPSPQSAMTDFPLTIRAMDVSVTPAQVQTAFHGVMELSELSRGSVTPRFVEFRNGTWSGMVQLNTPSVQTRFLAASPPGTSTRGQSGWFTVQLPGFSVSVTMSVVRENGTPLSGATVRFEQQGGSPQTKLTDATGKAIFQVPGAGHCTATLEMAGLRTEVDRFTLTGQPEVRPVITLRTLGKRPVVLVPGMLGSCNSYELDLPNRSAYPLLPKYRAELGELKILNPNLIRPFNDPVGWEALKSRLSAHYDVYEAPWDWRVPPIGRGEGEVTAWSKYLKPVIDKAIEQSGHSKVDVVAHSTGGLVARAYIESNYYEDNIGKFALVAVPNEGSANSYYMWFGGDPSREAIYANTSELNYELWNKPRKWKDLTQEGKLSFYRTQIPALEELLPVYFGSLTSDVGESLRSTAGYPGYMENPLYQLNLGDFERYSYNCAIEKVCAEVFYSASETTAYQIQIDRRSVNSQSGIYPHGRPTGENPVLGDKTVIPKSAVLDSRGQPFPLSTASRGGKHIGIIGKLASEIVEFLDKDRTFPATFSPADDPMPLAPSSSNQLVVAIRGRSRLWMIDPVLAGTGISPSTGHYSNDWARSTVTAEASGSTVAREDAPVGLYRGRVKGFAGETLSLAAQFFESNRFVVTNVTWIVGTNDITFDLQLDPALSNALSLLVVAAAPQAVKSFPSNGTCHLSWDQPTGSNIVGYRIYALREEESLFNVLAATTDLSHDTGLPWSQDGGGTNWFFAVVAVTTAGIESPYSDVVPNSQPTVARFIADVVRGPAPLAVTFTNQSQGSVTNWEWDFDGDGTIDSTEPNPTMVYSQAGNYSVSLTVTGSNGRDTRVAAGFVEVTLPLTVGVWGDPAWNRQAQVPAAAQNGVVAISTGTWHTLALKN